MNIIHAYLLARDSHDWSELASIVEHGCSELADPHYKDVRALIAQKLTGELKQNSKPKNKPFYLSPKSRVSTLLMFLLSGAGYRLKKSETKSDVRRVYANKLVADFMSLSPASVTDFWNHREQEVPDQLILGLMDLDGPLKFKGIITQQNVTKWINEELDRAQLFHLKNSKKNILAGIEKIQLAQYDAWAFGRSIRPHLENGLSDEITLIEIIDMILNLSNENFSSLTKSAKLDWFNSAHSKVKQVKT